ncbi:hypothetical protein E2C01_033354 [Portunus trituberculatus]|uniref:Uncharacterized protein n=1 Tax=Portunus trituberculatus TaxID=210409 RepID=A0A5B7F5B4_PORTR|nr:hypothetical protein [Portunus trituberculatus]
MELSTLTPIQNSHESQTLCVNGGSGGLERCLVVATSHSVFTPSTKPRVVLAMIILAGRQGEDEYLLAAWRKRFWSLRCIVCPSHKDSNVQQATVCGPHASAAQGHSTHP